MGSATDLHLGGRGFESSCEQIFFQKKNRNSILFAYTLLKFSFDTTVTWHSKHVSKRDLSKIKHWELECVDCYLIATCFSQRVEGTGVERRQ